MTTQPQQQQPGGYPTPEPPYNNPSQPQQPQQQQQQPFYYGYGGNNNQYPPVTAAVIAKTRPNLLYGFPIVGGLMMLAGTVLPWLSLAFATGFMALDGSINGFGGCNGSAIICTGVTKNMNFSPVDALIILGFAVGALLLGIAGLAATRAAVWQAGASCGVIGGGIALYDLINFSSRIADLNNSFNEKGGTGSGSVAAAAQTGMGLYLAVAGGIIVLVGFILAGYKRYPSG